MAHWYSGKTCRLSIMLSMTFGYFLVEIVFGYLTKSMALVADSFHMLSDVLALIVAFFCMKISRRKQSKKNTFGWVRAEVLGALVNAVFLLALCFSIFIEAIKRLVEGEPITDPVKILVVGAIGLAVNIIGIFMFHGHASLHGHSHARPVPLDLENDEEDNEHYRMVAAEAHSISVFQSGDEDVSENAQNRLEAENSGGNLLLNSDKTNKSAKKTANGAQLNMHGVFLHILGDALGSIIVIINAIVNWQVDNENLKKYLDPSLSLVMVLIISASTLPLLKESALILLQTVPTHINVRIIKDKLLKSVDGVLAIHDFHVWRLAGNRIIATAHIRCRNLSDYMKVAEKIKEFFHNEGIHSTTIQPEFTEVAQPEVNANGEVLPHADCVLVCPSKGECVADTCCEPNGTQSTQLSSVPSSQVTTEETSIDVPKTLIIPKTGISTKSSIAKTGKDSSVPLLEESTVVESDNKL